MGVRDENISRLNKNGSVTKRQMQIKLHKDDFEIKKVNLPIPLYIDDKFIFYVINRRLIFAESKLKANPLFNKIKQVINNFWLDQDQQNLPKKLENLNVRELTNDSIRMLLDFLIESTKDLIQYFETKRSFDILSSRIPTQLIKARIISTMWGFSSFREILVEFKESIQQELSGEYCCNYRMLLSYLSNQTSYKSKAEEVYLVFRNIFKQEPAEIKNVLHKLYHSEYKEAELIAIYQKDLIESPDNIDYKSIIRLNSKGYAFLDNIIINIDYFGSILYLDEQNNYLSLYELSPAKAINYVKSITNLIQDLWSNHSKYWIHHLAPTLIEEYSNKIPFENYKRNFAFGDSFYMRRVCDSVSNSINRYINEIVISNRRRILVPEEDKDGLNIFYETIDKYVNEPEFVQIISGKKFILDEEIEKLISLLPERNEISTLYHYILKIKKIIESINSIEKLRDYS